MLIEKLKLLNYRQFLDEEIEFPHSKKGKHITVIQGANGSGKTNILNAITWCLYGKEMHLGDKNKGLPILSTAAINKLKPSAACDVTVELTILDEEKKRMIFKRRATYRKGTSDILEKLGTTKFDIFYQEGQDMKRSEYPGVLVSRYLPEDIQNYFFFDCERLDDYFKSSSKHQPIKKEVFRISQLVLFEDVLAHLKKRNTEYAKQLKQDNPQAEETLKLINIKEKALQTAREELDTLRVKEKEAEGLEKEISEKLKSYPSRQEVNELQLRREKLSNLSRELEKEIKKAQEDQKDFLIESAPQIICYEPIEYALNLISGKIDKGEIPPDLKRDFLEKLLESNFCICGTGLSKGSKTRAEVEKLLKECDEITNITEELILERHKLEYMCKQLASFRNRQIGYSKAIAEKEKANDEANRELKSINKQFEDIDDEKINRLENRRQTAIREKNAAIEGKGMTKHEIQDLEKEIEELNKRYEKELERMKKNQELKRVLLFCKRAIAAAEEIKEDIMEEIRREIEKRTRNQFFELIWKKDDFKTIIINDNYEISVQDKDGRETIGTLSAGERQVLALSFMAALNMVSGFDAPLVIDTPLGRISREPKLNIAEKLPGYLNGKQLILLVTEEEYTPEVRKRIQKHVGKEYKIKFEERPIGNKAELVAYE